MHWESVILKTCYTLLISVDQEFGSTDPTWVKKRNYLWYTLISDTKIIYRHMPFFFVFLEASLKKMTHILKTFSYISYGKSCFGFHTWHKDESIHFSY